MSGKEVMESRRSIYDTLSDHPEVTPANPVRANWLTNWSIGNHRSTALRSSETPEPQSVHGTDLTDPFGA